MAGASEERVMRCPKCGHEQGDGRSECSSCGIIFHKYERAMAARAVQVTRPKVDSVTLAGRGLLLLLLGYWSLVFISAPVAANAAGESFLHLVNLPFHEFGHILFRPFPAVVTSLGGSLGQLMMPLVCLFVLLFKSRDAFGAAVCLWWFGENFLDIAPYINDARSLSLPLLGGNFGDTSPYGFHDWEFILTETGLLAHDHQFAMVARVTGSMVMIVALLWALVAMFRPSAGEEA